MKPRTVIDIYLYRYRYINPFTLTRIICYRFLISKLIDNLVAYESNY